MATTTEAYVVHSPSQPMTLHSVTYSAPSPTEILVQIAAFSLCASDLKAAAGKFHLKPPLIPGHESSGTVITVGSAVSSVAPGDKVVLSYTSCRRCRYCASGDAAYCERLLELNFSGRRGDGSSVVRDTEGREINGLFFGQSSMSRVVLAHENSAVKVECSEDELPVLAALGCGVQTGAGAVLNVCRPETSSRLAILGSGAVGVAAALAALSVGVREIVMTDRDERKIELVRAALGDSKEKVRVINTSHLDMDHGGLVEELKSETRDGKGFDYVLDCVGLPQMVAAGHAALAPRGMVVTVGGGAPGQDAPISMVGQLLGGRTYRGTHQGDAVPSVFIPMMLDMWRQGRFGFDKMLKFYKFEEVDKALEDLRLHKTIKPVMLA